MNSSEFERLLLIVRSNAVEAAGQASATLSETASIENLPRLLELLDDDDFVVREVAAWPVTELAEPAALHALLKAFNRSEDEGHDNDGFASALMDMAQARSTEVTPILQKLASSSDSRDQENAEWLLEHCAAD